MLNLILFADASTMNPPFGAEAWNTFFAGLRVMGIGMTAVIGVLFVFFLMIKLLIKLLPNKE